MTARTAVESESLTKKAPAHCGRKKQELEDSVFEYRNNGITMFQCHYLYLDAGTGKKCVNKAFIPPAQEIREMAKYGQKAFLDGKPYRPAKEL